MRPINANTGKHPHVCIDTMDSSHTTSNTSNDDIRAEAENVRRQKIEEDAKRYATRKEREENIRRHSDAYGNRWSIENAKDLLPYIRKQKDAPFTPPESEDIVVRTYNREDNKMTVTSLSKVIATLPRDTNGDLITPKPTAFGQVSLSPTMHISTNIFALIYSLYVTG